MVQKSKKIKWSLIPFILPSFFLSFPDNPQHAYPLPIGNHFLISVSPSRVFYANINI